MHQCVGAAADRGELERIAAEDNGVYAVAARSLLRRGDYQ